MAQLRGVIFVDGKYAEDQINCMFVRLLRVILADVFPAVDRLFNIAVSACGQYQNCYRTSRKSPL